MPRLFTALEVPTRDAERLAMLQAPLAGARWVDPDNYHITLRFIGDVDGPTADAFVEQIADIKARPIELQLFGIGYFGNRKPRTLWVGVKADKEINQLHAAHERAAQRAGLRPESRKYAPHVTIARLSGTRPKAITPILEAYGQFEGAPFAATRFVLFSSRPGSGGGPYVIEDAFPLSE